jgi:hypothetical protein
MNYTTLVTNIQNFMEDDSSELSASIDQIIDQAEVMIFQRLPNLPCYRSKSTASMVIGTSEYVVPTARMIRQVQITNASNVVYLNHRIDSYLKDYSPNSATTGTPTIYSTDKATTSGITLTVAPTPDATYVYEVDYVAPETGLSSANANNWIGDNAEVVLLSACLMETSAFLKAAETLNLYKAQFDEAVQLLQQEMNRNYISEYNGGI